MNSRIGTSAFTAESSFEQTLVEVWRQALVENAKVVKLGTERYPVRRTPKRRLWHAPAKRWVVIVIGIIRPFRSSRNL